MQKTGMILYRVTDEFGQVWSVTGFSMIEALKFLAESRGVRELDNRTYGRRNAQPHGHGLVVRIELWDTQAYQYETEQQSWNQTELDAAIEAGSIGGDEHR